MVLRFESLLITLFAVALLLGFIPSMPVESQLKSNIPSADSSLTELYSKVQPSVVQINALIKTENGTIPQVSTGFIYDNRGHILTSFSAIDGALEGNISVLFSDRSNHTAEVVGSDRHSDLAVLSVANISKNELTPLTLANSSQLRIGENVVSVGNHFSYTNVLTHGIVGKLGVLSLPNPEDNESFAIPDTILTDVPINEGGNGSPLLNTEGEVVGVNIAYYSLTGNFVGISLAVTSNTVSKIARSLVENGSYLHPYLGVSGTDMTADIGKILKLNQSTGFLVIDVDPTSPAAKAGVRGGLKQAEINGYPIKLGGDIIMTIDNHSVTQFEDILNYLEEHKKAGDNVYLTTLRDGKLNKFNIILDARPRLQEND